MFVFNDDLSVYCTRGDYCNFPVTGKINGEAYQFKPGDVVRFKAFRKKDCETVVIQRDFTVAKAADTFVISLTGEDTKIGGVISKPVDYWYEVELNPDTNPQTIVGYDEAGAKVFKLFPEGKDVDAEDIEIVGKKTLQELVDYALAEAKESGAFDGQDGYTPVKGVDYFDGKDGYTPVKGKDYFDGEDGYTPVKGVDYFTEADKDEIAEAVQLNFPNPIRATAIGEVVRVDDVSPLAHTADVVVRGKNLIPFPYILDASEGGGVTYTAQADGGIVASGTATAQHNFTLYYGKLIVDGVITISLSGEYTNIVGVLLLKDKTGTTLFNRNIDPTITVDTSEYPTAEKMELLIKRKINSVVSGTVYPQLEIGDTATDYERYIDPTTVTVTRYGSDEADNPATYGFPKTGEISIPTLSPTMTLTTDTEGVTIECEYNQDTTKAIGDIETALDSIIAIQNSLIGGDGA